MESKNGQWSEEQSVELAQLLLLDSHHYGVSFYNLDSRITGWSEGAYFITGWTANEVIGQPTTIFWTPEDNYHGLPEHEIRMIEVVGAADKIENVVQT